MSAEQTRLVVVTGAAGGIGSDIVSALRERGDRVVGIDFDHEAVSRLEAETGVRHIQADVADEASVSRAVAQIVDGHGVPQGVVNAAGINSRADFLDLALAEWRRVIDVNLTGTFLIGQAFARAMAAAHEPGSIVNIASIAARVIRRQDVSVYAASKAGVEGLTRGMAASLADQRIRVNAVAPGPIVTAMTQQRRETAEGQQQLSRGVLAGRLGMPRDVTHAVTFLLDPASDFITGSTLVVDGGVLVGCSDYLSKENHND